MYKLDSEKAEEPEIKLPTSTGKRILEKSSTSASLTMPKPLSVWTTTNCGKFLKEMGLPDHLTCLLIHLCAGQDTTVRTGHGTRDWFKIEKGVRQGFILSPCLFDLHAEYLMQNARLDDSQVESNSLEIYQQPLVCR